MKGGQKPTSRLKQTLYTYMNRIKRVDRGSLNFQASTLTAECCPGVRGLSHSSHLRQWECQSLPRITLRSAGGGGGWERERESLESVWVTCKVTQHKHAGSNANYLKQQSTRQHSLSLSLTEYIYIRYLHNTLLFTCTQINVLLPSHNIDTHNTRCALR